MVFFQFTKFCFKITAVLQNYMNQQNAFTK